MATQPQPQGPFVVHGRAAKGQPDHKIGQDDDLERAKALADHEVTAGTHAVAAVYDRDSKCVHESFRSSPDEDGGSMPDPYPAA